MGKEDNSYFAGFFDGEGYIGIGSGGRLEARVVNTYYPVLEKFKQTYGGNVYKRKKTFLRRKEAYDWVLVKQDDVINFLTEIHPFLQEKREKVDFYLSIKNNQIT